MAHTGPKPAPALALAPMLLTGQARPILSLMTTEGTKKRRSRATDLHYHPVAVCREATGPCRVPSQPQPVATQRTTGKLGREDAWLPSTAAPLLLRGLTAGSE